MKGYDYSAAGAYFVPSCAHARAWRFEHPQRCALAEEAWLELPERCPGMQSDALVVLPNHIHGIIALLAPKETDQAKTDLNAIFGASKSIIAVRWLA